MPTFNIPKQARNKYNFIKGSDNNSFITQSQLMMSSGGFGGGGNSGTTYSQVQQQINDTLADKGYVSYTYLKTINGYSLVGDGDIEITAEGSVDLSPYALKTYVADYVAAYAPEPDLSSYATKTYVSDYVATYGGNVDLSAYATKTYVADYVNTYAPEPDLSAYVTKVELDAAGYACVYECTYNQYNNIQVKDPDTIYIITDEDPMSLMGYATKSYVADYVTTYATTPDLSSYVTKTELNNAGYVTSAALSGMSYVTSSDLDTKLSSYETKTDVNTKVANSTKGNIIPNTDNTYTLGDSNHQYSVAYTKVLYINGYLGMSYNNFQYDSTTKTLTITI